MTPRTLPALRAAVARVLSAAGEADALRVTSDPIDGGRRAVAINDGHAAWIEEYGGTEADACEAAWRTLVARLGDTVRNVRRETDAAQLACDTAHRRERMARAALAVAWEIGGGE